MAMIKSNAGTAVIRVRFTEAGMHYWPGAPDGRAYLRSRHRHLFVVTVETEVYHDEREVEFHDLLEEARQKFHIEDHWSCERMARELARKLVSRYTRPVAVTVSEDGECEAEVTVQPALLKAATFGTTRDGWLIEKLERDFQTLDVMLTHAELEPLISRGQGFQVESDPNIPPQHYYDLKVLTPDEYRPFRLNTDELARFNHRTLHRPRHAAIFRGPLLICPKASFRAAAEIGRYSAAVSENDLLYTENFYGISFADRDASLAYGLSAILNSSLTSFQLAFGGGAWGLERSTVEPKDLLSIRVPDLSVIDQTMLTSLVETEAVAAGAPGDPAGLQALDTAVFDVYGLDPDEALLARESVVRARMLIFEGRSQRRAFIAPPADDTLAAYATSVVQVVNRYLRARRQRHLEATIYTKPALRSNWAQGAPGLTAVRFSMVSGAATETPIVRRANGHELEQISEFLRRRLQNDPPPYLSERRQLRFYVDNDLFVLKPSENRYWTCTAGLNDADTVLADHWLGPRHVAQT